MMNTYDKNAMQAELIKNDLSQKVVWRFSNFESLTLTELYNILALRESIFIVEQDVPYVDIDGKDIHCTHLMGYLGKELVAYLRIVPFGLFKPDCFSMGRVVLRQSLRGGPISKTLVGLGLEYLDSIRNGQPIRISSQLYLKDFYGRFGFVAEGEPYIEDRIPHIAMIKK
ncbi:GNAT family N-acetyltransferase [Methylobacillus pratensis]